MRKYVCDRYQSIAILGSFGKHYDLIVEAAKTFQENGFEVLAPKLNGIQDKDQSFILLAGDESNDPKELENNYIKKCLEADLVYVCDKDGYIGRTVSFELGVLASFGQEIFFMEEPQDELLASMIPYKKDNIRIPDMLVGRLKLCNALIDAFYDDNFDEPWDKTFSLPTLESKVRSMGSN